MHKALYVCHNESMLYKRQQYQRTPLLLLFAAAVFVLSFYSLPVFQTGAPIAAVSVSHMAPSIKESSGTPSFPYVRESRGLHTEEALDRKDEGNRQGFGSRLSVLTHVSFSGRVFIKDFRKTADIFRSSKTHSLEIILFYQDRQDGVKI